MDKRYQIFISSTFEDLKEERQAVLRAILELNHMPAGMELFPAADAEAWELIREVIETSDYYILVIGDVTDLWMKRVLAIPRKNTTMQLIARNQ